MNYCNLLLVVIKRFWCIKIIIIKKLDFHTKYVVSYDRPIFKILRHIIEYTYENKNRIRFDGMY